MDTTIQPATHFRPVSETMFQAFRGDGFVEFDSLISPDELEYISSTLMKPRETEAGFSEGSQFQVISATDGGGPARFRRILHPRDFAPGLFDTSFYQTTETAARQILGNSVRVEADISLLKPARIGSHTPRHQDKAFLDPAETCSTRTAINQRREAPGL